MRWRRQIYVVVVGKGKCSKIRVLVVGQFPLLRTHIHRSPSSTMDKGKSVIPHVVVSKIRIFLCDTHAESFRQTLALLCKLSYQDAVCSATEVVEMLESRGALAQIIMVEVDLLMAENAYLLRHIMRDKRLQRIPLIILTAEDQVCMTMKGLRLGAAGYLMKPLHYDELANLWMLLQN